MFERVLSRSLGSWRPTLSRPSSTLFELPNHETEVLNDCIALLRSDIFALEARHNSLLSNLLTISRCIKSALPPFVPCHPMINTDDDSLDLRSAVEILARMCSDGVQQRQQCLTRNNFQPSRAGPVSWRPQLVPETERPISPPVTLESEDLSPPNARAQLEIDLGVLVLKKAELMIGADKLEGDLSFWVQIWEDIKVERRKSESEYSCTYDARRPYAHRHGIEDHRQRIQAPNPLPGRRPSLDRKNAVRCIKQATIRRKEVPIREMLDRIQKVTIEEEKKRDDLRHDSGIDMSDDIEKVRRVQDLEVNALAIAELE
ncbi:uncharacterized protein PAC_11274 [Phialocephala subalpina]|uniref:Uncharacterized protein n=1 Tax=Phialocephala subalpina TaxID=576137 RepID=A0A1L7X8L2_9HELO|nr:uncharacterized protein PAC_11274 [Phialocephala subalpina]